MKLIIDIPDYIYKICQDHRDIVYQYIAHGTPLDSVKTEIERLKHQYTDVSGYRWWNNAIDNCLHTIRDVCDAESEDT